MEICTTQCTAAASVENAPLKPASLCIINRQILGRGEPFLWQAWCASSQTCGLVILHLPHFNLILTLPITFWEDSPCLKWTVRNNTLTSRVKRQLQEGKEVFKNQVLAKGTVCRIYREHLKLNHNKTHYSKMSKGSELVFVQWKQTKGHQHRKRWPTSANIREMHMTPACPQEMATIKTCRQKQMLGRMWRNQILYTVDALWMRRNSAAAVETPQWFVNMLHVQSPN